MSGKVLRSENPDGSLHGWLFECPGCEHAHVYDQRWTFNGNLESPSFTPSLLVKGQTWNGKENVPVTCHLYVTDGRIQFLPDCTHKLAGQTVDMPEWNVNR